MKKTSKILTKPEVQSLLDLVEDYRKERDKKLKELPFFYNVLEKFNVNENAHTSLLMRLLQYRPALDSFVAWIKEECGFVLPINKDSSPVITIQDYYIDGLIRERGEYAVIIENKVCGAEEQQQQLRRYIDTCKNLGYDENNIYILYLFDRLGIEPSEQTWGSYKDIFKDRYLVLSFSDDIINWLKYFLEELLEEDKIKLFRSGVIQYLDYLEMNFTNTHHIDMNQWLKEFIAKKEGQEEMLPNKEVLSLKDIINSLEQLTMDAKRLFARSYIEIWEEEIKSRYEEKLTVFKVTEGRNIDSLQIRIPYKIKEDPFDVLIEFGVKENAVYIGVCQHRAITKNQNLSLREKFKSAPTKDEEEAKKWNYWKEKKDGDWYGWYKVKCKSQAIYGVMPIFHRLVEDLESIGAEMVLKSEAE